MPKARIDPVQVGIGQHQDLVQPVVQLDIGIAARAGELIRTLERAVRQPVEPREDFVAADPHHLLALAYPLAAAARPGRSTRSSAARAGARSPSQLVHPRRRLPSSRSFGTSGPLEPEAHVPFELVADDVADRGDQPAQPGAAGQESLVGREIEGPQADAKPVLRAGRSGRRRPPRRRAGHAPGRAGTAGARGSSSQPPMNSSIDTGKRKWLRTSRTRRSGCRLWQASSPHVRDLDGMGRASRS